MTAMFTDARVIWAVVLAVLIPATVVGMAEVAERLRQRDSAYVPVVNVLRWWTIPLFALWAVLVALFGARLSNTAVRLVATALLLSAAVTALAAVRVAIAAARRRRIDDRAHIPQLLLVLPRVGIVVVVAWVLLDSVWGVDLSSALAALGVTSLVVSFALQDTLSGLASGLLLLGDAPFRPGDWIQYGEASDAGRPEGRVVDINWRSTRVETRSGDLVIVPNAALATATLVNFDRPTRLHRVVVPVQVAYVNPPTKARAMLLDAARSTPHVLADPGPQIRVVQIDDPLMGYEAHLWIDDYRLAPEVSSEFGALVWYQSHRHDVPLPSPAYDLYVYDGVAAAAAGELGPTPTQRRLRSSPLLDQLADEDIARLAESARAERYSQGETIVMATADHADVYVLWSGRARLVGVGPDGVTIGGGELVSGEMFGLFGRISHPAGAPRVKAVTDCEVVVVDAGVAGEVIGRNPSLSSAMEQIIATQRRRFERIAARRSPSPDAAGDGLGPDGLEAPAGEAS